MTRRGEGVGGCGTLSSSSIEVVTNPFRAKVSACRAVDSRETNIEPTLPGRPAKWSMGMLGIYIKRRTTDDSS